MDDTFITSCPNSSRHFFYFGINNLQVICDNWIVRWNLLLHLNSLHMATFHMESVVKSCSDEWYEFNWCIKRIGSTSNCNGVHGNFYEEYSRLSAQRLNNVIMDYETGYFRDHGILVRDAWDRLRFGSFINLQMYLTSSESLQYNYML
jgi:hypothetical protein